MKSKHFPLALVALVSLVSLSAHALGFDVASFFTQHQDAISGLSMLGAGSIDQVLKAMEGVERKLNSVNTNHAELADRLLQLEQKGTSGSGERIIRTGGLGEQFVKAFAENAELFNKTRSVRLELKAAGDAITTTSGRTPVGGGVGAVNGGVLGLQNAIPQVPASGVSSVEYSRFTGTQGAAAVQAGEGAAKAAIRPDHTLVVQSGLTVAGYAKMSRQALNDSAELKRAVDVTIARSVGKALDVALTTGGTGFSGGFAGLATAHVSTNYMILADTISEAVATMQTAGFEPDVVAINPLDWLQITVATDTTNSYLSGGYLGALPQEFRGLRVVLSPTVADGHALLIDSAHCELRVVDGFTVEVAYSGDDFTNNLVTILGETRVIPIFRTTGSMRLVSRS